jgi:hypothetical protein
MGARLHVLTSNTHRHVLEQRMREVARAMDVLLGGVSEA